MCDMMCVCKTSRSIRPLFRRKEAPLIYSDGVLCDCLFERQKNILYGTRGKTAAVNLRNFARNLPRVARNIVQ